MKKLTLFPFIVFSGVVGFSCSTHQEISEKETPPVSVEVGVPSQLTSETISVSGQLESRTMALISTRIMGVISKIHVNPGDKVHQGQLLVSINNDDIQAKRAQAVAIISEAEATLQDAERDFNRFEKLFKQGSASAKEFENASLRYHAVKANAEAAQQVKREAEAMLAYTNLTAPFSGVITQKYTDDGSMANPGVPILALEQPSGFQIRALVSESEVGLLRTEANAAITIKSTGRKFSAKIIEVSPSSQATGGRFQVKLKVPSTEDAGLFSGMYVNVSLVIQNSGARRLFVPASAIKYRDQLTGLYTVDHEHKAQLRWIKIGKRDGDRVEVLAGLQPEEEFIMHSDDRLYSGLSISINHDKVAAQ